jgi:ABC-type lipoprotein release transport system permease subunit
MGLRETIRAALIGVARRPLRYGLAILGVTLATATLVALIGLSNGLRYELATRVGERPLLTAVQVSAEQPRAGEPAHPLDPAAVAEISRVAGVREAVPVIVVPLTLRAGDRTPGGTALGMSPARGAPYTLHSGRPPGPGESDGMVLTSAGARSLGLDSDAAIGQRLTLELRRGAGAERRTIAARVVGVTWDEIPGLGIVPLVLAEDAIAWIATGESDAARDLRLAQQAAAALVLGGRAAPSDLAASRYTAVWALTEPGTDARSVRDAIERLGYSALSNDAAAQTLDDLFRLVNSALAAIGGVALVVAALGVVNALVTSVSERTVEIGVLKAIGASDATVERLFLAEAAVVGVAGGVAGIALGWSGGWLAALGGQALARGVGFALAPRVDLALVLLALAAAIAVSLAAGWLPARHAARLLPAAALRAD